LEYLRNGGASEWLNLGNGRRYSVKEVIDTARQVTNCDIEARVEPPGPVILRAWWRMPGRRDQFWVGTQNTRNSKRLSELPGNGIKLTGKVMRSDHQ
jgi:hypothetical protein